MSCVLLCVCRLSEVQSSMWGKSGLGASQALVEAAFEKMRAQGGAKDSVPLRLLIDSFNAKALPKVGGRGGGRGGRGRQGAVCRIASLCRGLTPASLSCVGV